MATLPLLRRMSGNAYWCKPMLSKSVVEHFNGAVVMPMPTIAAEHGGMITFPRHLDATVVPDTLRPPSRRHRPPSLSFECINVSLSQAA